MAENDGGTSNAGGKRTGRPRDPERAEKAARANVIKLTVPFTLTDDIVLHFVHGEEERAQKIIDSFVFRDDRAAALALGQELAAIVRSFPELEGKNLLALEKEERRVAFDEARLEVIRGRRRLMEMLNNDKVSSYAHYQTVLEQHPDLALPETRMEEQALMSEVAVVKVAAGEHSAGWKQIRYDREELYRKILGENEPD